MRRPDINDIPSSAVTGDPPLPTAQRIAQNHATFEILLDRLEEAVTQQQWEAALGLGQTAGTIAWLQSCGLFASPRLEALLAKVGHALPDAAPTVRGADSRRQVLTVMSSAHATGGHTRLACRWIALDHDSEHTLVLTRQEQMRIPQLVTELVDGGRARLVILEDDAQLQRAKRLRELINDADTVVLHMHPDDPLPIVALAGMQAPPPVLLEDHANHVFWMGATVSNLVVGLHQAGMRIATGRRGVPRAHVHWLPLPVDYAALDRGGSANGEVRDRYGIPENAPLLMSSGAPYKYAPIDGISLASLVEPVLAARPQAHLLLVGPSTDWPGTDLASRYPDRVHFVGHLRQPELIACYHACDIYLDSLPFPSGTALCEAAVAGRPVLKFAPETWRQCGFSVDSDAIPPPLYIHSDADGYRQSLLTLIDTPALGQLRGRLAGELVRQCYSDAHFQSSLPAIYALAEQLPRITLDEAVAAPRTELLDELLCRLADNLEAAKLLKDQTAPGPIISTRPATPQELHQLWLNPRNLTPLQVKLLHARLPAPDAFRVVVFDPHGDAEGLTRTLDSLRAQSHEQLSITVLSATAAPGPDTGDVAILALGDDLSTSFNAAAQASDEPWLLPLRAGDTLSKDALLLLAAKAAAEPELVCCYMDEDGWTDEGLAQPIFKPDVNLDLLRSYPYVGSTLAMRRDALMAAGGLRAEPGELAHYDFLFRCIERFGLHTVGHLAEVAYHAATPFSAWLSRPELMAGSAAVVAMHLQTLGIRHDMLPGGLPGFNRVRYLHAHQPPVSIIVPTRDQLPMLNGLIDSLVAKTNYRNYELLIVDNDSQDPSACAYLDGLAALGSEQIRVLRYPHPFNYSAINNFAAREARGEYLILLNNDTAVLHEDWIEALLNHAQRPEVGIVGAKLHYPDGRIQHAGVVLGMHGPAGHPLMGQAMDAPGYMHRLQVDQNYIAVTAACLMIRASVYAEVGGLDEQDFKVSYNDIDLCLKVQQAGYLTVWTPYARLMHEGNVSQSKVDTTAKEAKVARFRGEQSAMYRKWMPLLARDPAYNRNLSLDGNGFDLDTSVPLAWQPFAKPLAPRLFCVAADDNGCGHYRVRQPFLSMRNQGLAEGVIAGSHLSPVNMERFAPQALVLQRQLTEQQIEIMRGYKEFIRTFKVYELDDYLPNVPLKSAFRNAMPKDVLKALRRAVALTDRFVVSTAPLAEQFAGLHSDIRVVPNRLPVDWWDQLPASERRIGRKPRVGWGGGNSHRGDLELIADVVRDLADEVEWVFFGMCPDKLRPYVHEFHAGVPIGQYPAKLASLNLDLALAPLEENIFNACKSNLRLLEYGACGFPVICSDIACYQGDLPVTRVRNRYKEWTDAIRMHLDELDATARQGDALRETVHRDWMLSGDNLLAWRNAWLPD